MYTFQEEHVKKLGPGRIHIKIQAPLPPRGHDVVSLKSPKTGVIKTFKFDKEASDEKAMNCEYWDGEENHRLYSLVGAHAWEPVLTLEIWETPYDEHEVTLHYTWLEEE